MSSKTYFWMQTFRQQAQRILCTALFLTWACANAAPDEVLLGRDRGYPVGTRSTWSSDEGVRVGSYSNQESVYSSLAFERLLRSTSPNVLPTAATDLTASVRYTLDGRNSYSIQDYLDRNRVTGLLVIKDDQILLERYQYERTGQHRLTSMSMAKTLTALAVGLAVKDGHIRSVDDPVTRYLPQLGSSQYGRTSIRQVLNMSSGAYNPPAFDALGGVMQIVPATGTGAPVPARSGVSGMAALNPVTAQAPGQKFSYFGGDTFVLSLLVRAATGQTPAALLSSRVWGPMGAEDDATWITDAEGNTLAHFGFNARLRDWGRLGMLLARNGRLQNGTELLPSQWLYEMTAQDPARPHLAAGNNGSYFGYGYQTWLFPTPQRRFALLGLHGQAIFVDPELRLVMVQTAAWANNSGASSTSQEQVALFEALVNRFGSWSGTPARFAADTQNSPIHARRLVLSASASSADKDLAKKLVIVAVTPGGQLFGKTVTGWQAIGAGPLPTYSATAANQITVDVLGGAVDMSSLHGTHFFAGWGRDDTDILDNRKFQLIHIVQ